MWDLRLFGRPGRKRPDFGGIRQAWLREAAKAWAAATIGRVGDAAMAHRVGSLSVFSAVLASGPGGGHDPAGLGRADIERFLARVRSPGFPAGSRPWGTRAKSALVEDCSLTLREARELGLLDCLGPSFAFRRGDRAPRATEEPPGRALPATVVAQLDARLDLLAEVPGAPGGARVATLGVLGEQAGAMAVLAYQLLKGTGRRVGEVASLRLECLDVDEHGKDVLVYDNHKAGRMGRRLPLAGSTLVAAIGAQQTWVRQRFAATPAERLWLLPRPHKNTDGTNHLDTSLVNAWFRGWLGRIGEIDAGPPDGHGNPVPFDKTAIRPHAFRHTYAQTMADSGVAPSVLRDLMDHRSLSTTLGYYRVGDARKRAAMELVARHTVDNHELARPVDVPPSALTHLRESLAWVAVPMGKCSEPTNVRAGGQACPIRYQCAACPHFESDPSYLPELRAYADELRREREAMVAATAAPWAVDHVAFQLEVILGHIATHQARLAELDDTERNATTKPRPPCAKPAKRCRSPSGDDRPAMADNSAALGRARRKDSRLKHQRALGAIEAITASGEAISFPAVAKHAGVSVSFLYAQRQLAAIIAAARDRQRQAGQDRAWQLPPRSLITEQSLRVELANAKEHNRRLSEQVTALQHRLARQLGADADTARGLALAPALDDLEKRAAELEADNHRQREQITQLEANARELAETLDAARAVNRELMNELNRRPDHQSPPRQSPPDAELTCVNYLHDSEHPLLPGLPLMTTKERPPSSTGSPSTLTSSRPAPTASGCAPPRPGSGARAPEHHVQPAPSTHHQSRQRLYGPPRRRFSGLNRQTRGGARSDEHGGANPG